MLLLIAVSTSAWCGMYVVVYNYRYVMGGVPLKLFVVAAGRELNIKSVERGARRPYIGYGSFVWNMGVCGACEADGGRGCPTWPVIQRASLNASLFGSSGHLGASLQRSLGRTSFVLDVLHTAVFTSWKVAGMYSVSMIQSQDIHIVLLGDTKLRPRQQLWLPNFFVYRRDVVSPRGIAFRDTAVQVRRDVVHGGLEQPDFTNTRSIGPTLLHILHRVSCLPVRLLIKPPRSSSVESSSERTADQVAIEPPDLTTSWNLSKIIFRLSSPCFAFLNLAAKSATSALLTTCSTDIIVPMSSTSADAADAAVPACLVGYLCATLFRFQ
ncbi:hypothetical protein EVAR_101850_1 [Eumeta japonica]|uniref:Uncharacterized protein n=1 Tax=Eumeta variegata TaxID=151549 RepID=A0A4C1SMY9_EUMVA|nr:hypothetical protein EVAR_101850_1 [Eumeta japonica]